MYPPYGDTKLTRLKGAKMVTTTLDLFRDPFFIGFNREMERMAHVHQAATRQTYPPYDVLKLKSQNLQTVNIYTRLSLHVSSQEHLDLVNIWK